MSDKISASRLDALRSEIIMSEKINEQELEPILSEAINRYTGKHVPVFGSTWDIVLNEIYPIIQNNLPSIFFRNPRVFLKARNKTFIKKQRDPVTMKMVDVQADSSESAKTQEAILNYMLGEIKYKNEVRKVLLDALLFPYAVLWHGYKGNFGMTEEQSIIIRDEQIFVKRINPMNFIHDPMVNMANIDEARWVGRIIDVPVQDILDDDKLDIEKGMIKGFQGFGELVGRKTQLDKMSNGKDAQNTDLLKKPLLDFADKDFRNSASARFLKVYEIFMRPTKKERRQGKNGYILLLCDEQDKPLRQNEWVIKAEGFPGKILQFNPLNDELFGISDIDTYKEIADQKNIIINLQLRNAQENTKNWVGISKAGMDEEDVTKIQQGDNTIILFEDGKPSERMYVAAPGGSASGELYTIDGRIQKNLEDKSGVTDLKRGFLQSGEESAASVKIRAAGGGARPAYRQDIMSDFLKESCEYLNDLNKQFVPYKDAVRIVGSLALEWSENFTREDIQADTDAEINVVSMLPENPEKELEQLNQTLMLMVQGLTVPQIVQKLAQENKTINLAPLIEQILLRQRINNPEVFRNIKPEESQGFVSVQQIREAKANVDAALRGQPIPVPPNPNDDHVAKLEVYTSIQSLLKEAGQISDALEQLIQTQALLLQQLEEKQATPGQQVKLPKAGVKTV